MGEEWIGPEGEKEVGVPCCELTNLDRVLPAHILDSIICISTYVRYIKHIKAPVR